MMEGQQGVAGVASLNTNKIEASMVSFSTVPVAGMVSLNTNKIVASMVSFSTAAVAGMASYHMTLAAWDQS